MSYNLKNIKFIKPIDGDVLFSVQDGVVIEDTLEIKVELLAPKGSIIRVNGVVAASENERNTDDVKNTNNIRIKNIDKVKDEKNNANLCCNLKENFNENNKIVCEYSANIRLDAYRNAVEAINETTGAKEVIYIYWFKEGYMTYRVAVDDVIFTLEDIAKNCDSYKSLFDSPYLAMFKELHETYDIKAHMHIYYQNADGSFNLSMFPDKYKEEFKANASWLKFTFHSLANDPASPYKYNSYDSAFSEGKLVEKEIKRFAGNEVLSNVTSQHWADSDIYGTRAFRALGYKVLDGYFIFDNEGKPYVSYYLNKEQTTHAAQRDFWVDNKEDIIFVKDDIIIDTVPLDKINEALDAVKAHPAAHAFMYLLIHEQYFYPFYEAYQPDYKEKLFAAVKWAHDNGYKPTFIKDIAFEKVM
jgi:hypothetical protein